MNTAINLININVVFNSRKGHVIALDSLNLKVKRGQVFGFIGPNGAGKTTAMHVLLGFIEATSGTALIFNNDVRKSIARTKIGFLPEHPDTYKFLTGIELLKMTGNIFLIKGKQLSSRIDEVLDMVGLKDEAACRKIATYSRGMLQRICMAQALINDPELVILDEPTGGLDPIGRMEIRKIITNLKEKEKTVFFSSHELSEVELVCDYIAVLSRGHIVAEGELKNLVAHGESLEKYFMKIISK